MSFELLICDCDGVLVDSEVLACKMDSEELLERGFNYPLVAILSRFVGMSQRDMISAIEKETGRVLDNDFSAVVSRRVMETIAKELEALPQAATVLSSLDIPLCVASSSSPEKLDLALSVTGLKPLFGGNIFSSVLVKHGKPAPDLFLYAARSMGVSPSDCCVIEDSVAGVTAALAAGMKVIGFTGGGHCTEDHSTILQETGAHVVTSDWAEVPRILEKLAMQKASHLTG